MFYVKNPYKKAFVLQWGGDEIELEPDVPTPLPNEFVAAFFPNEEALQPYASSSTEIEKVNNLYTVLFMHKNRWGEQIDNVMKVNGGNKKDFNVAFLQFLSAFEVTASAQRKKRELKVDVK